MRPASACGPLALAAALGAGAAQAATFTCGNGPDTTSGLDGGASAGSPESGGNSQFHDVGSRVFTTTASAAANLGVVSALAQLSAVHVAPGFVTTRPEAFATMAGTMNVCAPGSTAQSCIAPPQPIPLLHPNLVLEARVEDGGGLGRMTGLFRASGDLAGTSTAVITSTSLIEQGNRMWLIRSPSH